ncbi:glycoside hydrolase family 31 protein [Exiguobacterium sp. N4-1P]|uniref:glycoside hydrolase family 31 protein n=1 Tax=unclassified Exiguobacterium TaxID=2644629 RepID=UPI000B592818|nr:glycoside hydrolase family 31 protein [Exiguobacterium sp. N4-1P]ASI35174.1 alpha-xylosidase [Exiguobacterium sp. N4-1P]ASI37187.1 alpha-xylosidase [Exiguobacterium sp. N4-1P]
MRTIDESHFYTRDMKPLARPEAIIQGDHYRFTILTSRMIRMEYAEDGRFEDRPTQTVWNRDFPVPSFRIVEDDTELQIITEHVHLHYTKGPFAENTLYVDVLGNFSTYYSRYTFGGPLRTLKGTARTLDHADGEIPLEEGIISRQGYAAIDDSASFVLTEDHFVEPRQAGAKDIYYFGYGHDYKQALKDFYHLTGPTPMLPRQVLGNWWSRYWRYNEKEYKDLMTRFKKEDVPFSVSVIDMDWHVTDIPEKYGSGWTGYTWNRDLFPDPRGFLKWLKDDDRMVTLNLHPADGVRGFEEAYEAMAVAMGLDPDTEDRIPFDFSDKTFIENYFTKLHHPHEADGVDFWWIDWQQGANSKIKGLDPLWMLNHYHALDIARDGNRPLIFSRYAGPGSHRYPVGFSGDTIISWASLKFQPYFTATASNIGYGWWSHDIGGHQRGEKDDELSTRWLQYGVFSPIMRLHSTMSIFNGKEPWRYSVEAEQVMKRYLRLRHQLVPYIYTMNARNHFDGLPLVSPMYYEHPEDELAYAVPNQYYFGTEMMVAPIVEPMNQKLHVAATTAWLPDGEWFDFFSGHRYTGGKQMRLFRKLDEQAVLAKAGAIIPLGRHVEHSNALHNPEHLDVHVFPGASNQFTLFEDDSVGVAHRDGENVETSFELDWVARTMTIAAPIGKQELLPEKRVITVILRGVNEGYIVRDGETLPGEYDPKKQSLTVSLGEVTETVTLSLQVEMSTNDNRMERLYEFLDQAEIGYDLKDRLYRLLTQRLEPINLMHQLQALDLEKDLVDCLLELMLY